jgi:O-antigen ligase
MFFILIGYMFLFIHRPFEIWPALGEMHLERVYMLGALLAVAVYSGKQWLANVQHVAFFAFAAAVLLCWMASPWAALGEETVENYLKLLVFYILIILVVHDEPSLNRLVLAFLGVMFLYMTHSLREYLGGRHAFRMGIPRMIGVDLTLGDPNSFGASIVYALPFVVPFWLTRPSGWMRAFLVAYVGLSVVCIGLTGSRSSFVGLILWFLVLIARSRWRFRLAVLAVVAAPVLWAALPDSLQNRFETIIHPEVGPESAKVSGEGRLEGLEVGLELWSQFPVTGCGPGVWRPATGRLIESHNLYGQLVGEMGALGLAAFAAILACFWVNLRWVKRTYQAHPEWGHDFLYHCCRAVGWGVFLLLFEGNFGHNLFRFSWLWYGGFLVIARHCIQQRLDALTYWEWQWAVAQVGNLPWGTAGWQPAPRPQGFGTI